MKTNGKNQLGTKQNDRNTYIIEKERPALILTECFTLKCLTIGIYSPLGNGTGQMLPSDIMNN